MDLTLAWVHIEAMYFSGFCGSVGKEVLLGSANLVDLRDGPHGFELHYSCYCGQPGVVYPGVAAIGRCGEPACV